MSDLFKEVLDDAKGVEEKLLGPTYPYYKNIKTLIKSTTLCWHIRSKRIKIEKRRISKKCLNQRNLRTF